MRRTLTLSVLLLVLGGCSLIDPRNTSLGCNDWDGCRQSSHKVQTEYKNVDLEPNYNLVAYPKAEAMNLKTGERFHFGHAVVSSRCNIGDVGYKHCPKIFVQKLCEDLYGSKCVLSRFNDEIYFFSLEDYLVKEGKIEQQKIADKISLEEKRLAVIHALKDRCISYGFTGDSNVAACIQREAQFDYEIEQKERELKLAQQSLQNQSQTEDGIPWWGLILGGIAEGAAEGYKQSQIIKSLDSRYEKKDIYRYCRPNC